MRSITKWMAGALLMLGGVAAAQTAADLAPPLTPTLPSGPTAAAPAMVPTPGGAHPLTAEDVDAWLDGYMPYALHAGDIAGAVVAVVKDGKLLSARGYGYADVEKRTLVDPARTLFRPGSVSKLVTWTAVMQLVEQHKLDLDRDVNAYLDFKIPPRDGKPITLRNIMTHTAGFEETAKNLILTDPKQLIPLGTYVKSALPARIFAPGTTPAYSNYATALAGYIVQRVSGLSFDDYVEQRIFAPLGMTTATFRQPLPARLVPQAATGYPEASGKASKFELVIPAPAGALSATGTDMARFMIAHLQQGRLGDNRILQPATAEMMHNTPLTIIPSLNRMELGFFETNINGREVIAHLGDTQGFHTSLHLFMKDNVGFYVSLSSGGKEGAAHGLRSAVFQDFADRYFPSTEKDGRVDPKLSAEHARMMAGQWWGSRHSESNFLAIAQLIGQVKVSVGPKGELMASSPAGLNGKPRRWVEVAPFIWRDRDSHERIGAKVVDGKVVRWSFDLVSPFIVYDRVPSALSAAWLLPALYASIAVLALTLLYWPAAWFIRRRYSAPLAVTGKSRLAYRATRIASGLELALLLSWFAVVTALFGDLSNASMLDPVLLLLEVLGLVVFIGAVIVAGWNVWLTWQDNRRWTRKLWSVLILLATLVILHVAYSFGLLAITTRY